MATASFTRQSERDVFYPVRDGKPMAESELHQETMIELIHGLRDWFAPDPQVYIAGNLFLYYVQGDPTFSVSPDVMVVRGANREPARHTYKTWENHNLAPQLVVEVSSKSTKSDDLRHKFVLYRDALQVREYFVFDPLHEYLKPALQGFRLDEGDYFAIDPEDGRLPSEVLDLHLVAVGPLVRLFDPRVGQIIPTRVEALATARQSIREQATTLASRDEIIRERDQALERAERVRVELLAEIARLRAGKRSD